MSLNKIPPISRHFKPGETLFEESDPSDSLFLLKRGTVAIRKAKGQGQIEIARIYTGEVLGELSFFDRRPRSATAIALTDVEALEIRFGGLEAVYEGVPDYFKTIIAALAERLRRADDQIRRLQTELIDTESLQSLTAEFSATDALAAIKGPSEDMSSESLEDLDLSDEEPGDSESP